MKEYVFIVCLSNGVCLSGCAVSLRFVCTAHDDTIRSVLILQLVTKNAYCQRHMQHMIMQIVVFCIAVRSKAYTIAQCSQNACSTQQGPSGTFQRRPTVYRRNTEHLEDLSHHLSEAICSTVFFPYQASAFIMTSIRAVLASVLLAGVALTTDARPLPISLDTRVRPLCYGCRLLASLLFVLFDTISW